MNSMLVRRRGFLQAAGTVGASLSLGAPLLAQDFPARPVTLICPFAAGGSVDQYMRALAVASAKHMGGQNVIIDNKPGAGGLYSASLVSKARPDGYTLAMTSGSIFRAPWLEPKAGISPLTDFTYVIGMTSLEFCAVVRADSSYRNFADFMKAGKAKPTQFAAGDPTTAVPVLMKGIEEKYGGEFQHIPYKSGADMVNALLGGHVGIVLDSVGSYVSQINAGKLRLLAALGTSRFKAWPDVPTAVEQGYDVVVSSPMGLIGPPAMKPATVQSLHDIFRKAMREPEIERMLDLLNQPEWYRNSKDFESYAQKTYQETGEMLRRAKLI
ncbi:MAG TPA: tripartite tricarboxylate transporter substrate binding protein [Ramlibacter sp.]|nr:tripartite tricarboxylate transporter substrate binding protein [Ramlibacter sp.]